MLTYAYTPAFLRQFKHLEKNLQEEAVEKIELLCQTPNHPSLRVHKLQGRLAGRLSFSVNYRYRIIFEYRSKDEVLLHAIGDHSIYD